MPRIPGTFWWHYSLCQMPQLGWDIEYPYLGSTACLYRHASTLVTAVYSALPLSLHYLPQWNSSYRSTCNLTRLWPHLLFLSQSSVSWLSEPIGFRKAVTPCRPNLNLIPRLPTSHTFSQLLKVAQRGFPYSMLDARFDETSSPLSSFNQPEGPSCFG